MKPPLKLLLALLFASCVLWLCGCATQKPLIKATIDHIEQEGDSSIVFVKHKRLYNNSGYDWYWAKFGKLTPDLKRGNVINLDFRNSDSCKCVVFKPLNIKR